MIRIHLFILLLIPSCLAAQLEKGIIVKTLPFQDIFYRNPNIAIEKIISDHFSVELGLALRNGDWVYSGGEGPPIPSLHISNGFSVGIAGRYYLPSRNPLSGHWYSSALLRYNHTRIDNVEFIKGLHTYSRNVELTRSGPELGIVFGRQFVIIQRLVLETYMGTGAYLRSYKEKYISGNEQDVIQKDLRINFRPYAGFSLGFKFGSSK